MLLDVVNGVGCCECLNQLGLNMRVFNCTGLDKHTCNVLQ
jgi:hypothetical protein